MNDIFFYVRNTLWTIPDFGAVLYLSLSIVSLILLGLLSFYFFTYKKLPISIRWSLSRLHTFLVVSFLFLLAILIDVFYFDYLGIFHLKFCVLFILFLLFFLTFYYYYTFSRLSESSKILQVFSGPIANRFFLNSLGALFANRKRLLFIYFLPFLIFFLPYFGPSNLISLVIDNSQSMEEFVDGIKLDILSRIKNNEFKSNTSFLLTSIDHESSLQPLKSTVEIISSNKEKLSAKTVFCKEPLSLRKELEQINTPVSSNQGSPILECVRHNMLTASGINSFNRRSLLIFTDGVDNTVFDSSNAYSCMMQMMDNSGQSVSSYYNDVYFISYNYTEGSKTIFDPCPQIEKFNGNSSIDITKAISSVISRFLIDFYFLYFLFSIVFILVFFVQLIYFKS